MSLSLSTYILVARHIHMKNVSVRVLATPADVLLNSTVIIDLWPVLAVALSPHRRLLLLQVVRLLRLGIVTDGRLEVVTRAVQILVVVCRLV